MSTYIRKGSQDRAMVKELQRALGLIVDGVFGSKTQAALMNFQSQANLVADGIAGPKTFQALGLLDTDLKSNIIRTLLSVYFDNSLHPRMDHAKVWYITCLGWNPFI